MSKTLNLASIFFAFLAAVFWFISAYAYVTVKDEPDESGWVSATISSDGKDLIKSLKRQSFWSAIAAVCAGLAAILQLVAF